MTDLSPTAKAILEAYENSPFEYDTAELTWIAAVLRATAAELAYGHGSGEAIINEHELLAIATELETAARD
jgi:hypothetical protein